MLRRLLYADDDHLSTAGSMFEYQNHCLALIEQRRHLKMPRTPLQWRLMCTAFKITP